MMYRCERCGSAFNPIPFFSFENCPRCRARDGVSVSLIPEEDAFEGPKRSDVDGDTAPGTGDPESP
jgi:hypothetical protein